MNPFFQGKRNQLLREKAEHFLTGAKLLEMIRSEDQDQRRNYLRNYCAAMGDGAAADQKPMEVLRTYYAEAFSVERVWGPQLSVKTTQFLISYTQGATSDTVLEKNVPQIPDAINRLCAKEPAAGFWHDLLNLFVTNRAAAENILPEIYRHPAGRGKAVAFLERIGVDAARAGAALDDFFQAWEEARRGRSRDLAGWEQRLRALLTLRINVLGVDEMIRAAEEARRDWLYALDGERLATIRSVLADQVGPDVRSADSFEEQERRLKQAQVRLEELGRKIVDAPTWPSIGVFYPLVRHLLDRCRQAEQDLLDQSTPVVELDLLTKQVVPDADGVVSLAVEVSNRANCSPITDVRLTIGPTPEYRPAVLTFAHPESIRGGETGIVPCKLRLNPEARDLQTLTVEAILEYKDRRDQAVRSPRPTRTRSNCPCGSRPSPSSSTSRTRSPSTPRAGRWPTR
ncbi:MAG: hypothetical protein K2X87_11460 [Gemmataceae bacterium]|nr:hypothetical protein [Gemmataceae bacterium]